MNTPIQNLHSKVANSTQPSLKSTVTYGNPRAEAAAGLQKAIDVRKAMKRTDDTYKSLRKQGKYFGSGFGG